MCRFLIVRSKNKIDNKALFSEFAEMCRTSKEWQGDGWGVVWLDHKDKWQRRKSLSPIWTSRFPLKDLSQAKTFVVHARSASFKEERGSIDLNQPFINDGLAFVFNGFLHGVKLSVKGRTGAAKLFNMVTNKLKKKKLTHVLPWLRIIIRKNTKKVLGFNVGLINGKKIAALCDFDEDKEYYTLWYHKGKDKSLVCSAPLRIFKWKQMKKGQTITI